MRKLILMILPMVLLVSCREEIEYRGPETEPMLFVNAELSDLAGSVNTIFVGKTFFFNEWERSGCLSDADIVITRNGEPCGDVTYDAELDSFLFVTPDGTKPGDRFDLKVSCPGFEVANASAYSPVALDCRIADVQHYDGEGYRIQLNFECPDYDKTDGFYFSVKIFFTDDFFGDGWTYLVDYTTTDEMLSAGDYAENVNIWNLIFEGESIEYIPLRMNAPTHSAVVYTETYSSVKKITVVTEVVPKEYVEYYKSVESSLNMSVNPFVEPVQLKSNLSSGTGVFAVVSRKTKRKMIVEL